MKDELNFIRECGAFYFVTVNGDCPAGRPFGAIMEHKGNLYIAMSNKKSVYSQLIANANMQIVAYKLGTRDWLRISGKATECFDLEIKQKMLIECPAIVKYYSSPDCDFYSVFKIDVEVGGVEWHEGWTLRAQSTHLSN